MKILQTVSQWSTGVGRLLPFGPGDVGIFSSTRIRPITGRPSLLPASYSRNSNSVPCGFACPNAPGRIYGVSTFHVPDDYVGDLGPSLHRQHFVPAGAQPRPPTGRLPFGSSLSASFGLFNLTALLNVHFR